MKHIFRALFVTLCIGGATIGVTPAYAECAPSVCPPNYKPPYGMGLVPGGQAPGGPYPPGGAPLGPPPSRFPPGGNLYVDIQLGGYRLDAPGFSFGEHLDPFPLAAAGISSIAEFSINHDTVNAFYPKLGLGVELNNDLGCCWIGSNLAFEVALFYVERNKHDHPGNGVLGDFALPLVNGGGDFIASTLGIPTAFSGVDFRRGYRYAGMQAKIGSDFLFNHAPNFYLNGFFEFDYVSLQQNYKVDIGSLIGGANALNFHLHEALKTNYYDFGLGLGSSYFFSPGCRSFFLFGEGALFVSCAKTRFKAREEAIFPIVSLLANELHRESTEVSGKARAQFGCGYQFGYNFVLSLLGQVEYWGYIPQVINPHRVGNNLAGGGVYDYPAHFDEQTALNYSLTVGLTFIFF